MNVVQLCSLPEAQPIVVNCRQGVLESVFFRGVVGAAFRRCQSLPLSILRGPSNVLGKGGYCWAAWRGGGVLYGVYLRFVGRVSGRGVLELDRFRKS